MTYRFPEMWFVQGLLDCDFDDGVEQLTLLFVRALGLEDDGAPLDRASRCGPPPAEPPAQPSVAACHSSSCGASRGQRANRPSSWASLALDPLAVTPRRLDQAGLGSSSATASEVARVWCGSLSPLRKTSAGRSSVRAPRRRAGPGTCSPSRGQ